MSNACLSPQRGHRVVAACSGWDDFGLAGLFSALCAALMYAAIVIGGVDLIFEESIRRHGSLAQGFAVLCVLTVATWFTEMSAAVLELSGGLIVI
jgi:hypothetical protein